MRSLSSVGLGLSLVFGCLLLALIAELYYLLWWKRRIINREIEEHDYSSPAREFFYMFCFKKPSSSSLSSTALNPQHLCSFTDTQVHEPQAQFHSNKDTWLNGEDSVDNELWRLQNLSGPPRFLFTINEETKEDLESDEAKSRGDSKSRKGSRSRSLSDILVTIETPFLTPLDSPSYFTPPLTPRDSSYSHNGFNPLFETSSDAEFNRIRSSPPPKFKFLRDAEDKLHRTKAMEEDESDVEEENDFFITLIVDENRGIEVNHHPNLSQYSSTSSSQILPLVASPPTFRPSSSIKNPILQ